MTKQALKKWKNKFPSIYRIFPAVFGKQVLGYRLPHTFEYAAIIIVSFLLLFAILVSGIDIVRTKKEKEAKLQKKEMVLKEIAYWQKIVSKHSGYRDGYFRLALLLYEVGDREGMSQHIQKTLDIDPNYQPARDLEKEMNK